MKPISTSALKIGARCRVFLLFGGVGGGMDVWEGEGMRNYSKKYLKSERTG